VTNLRIATALRTEHRSLYWRWPFDLQPRKDLKGWYRLLISR
jgi:hypothetical protein